MNIIAFLDDKPLIQKLKALCKEQGYRLKVVPNATNISDFLIGSSLGSGKSPWIAHDFQAILVDAKSAPLLQKMNREDLNRPFFLYPFMFIMDGIHNFSAILAKELEVFSVIDKNASKEEFILRLEVLNNSFHFIRQMREWAFRDMLTGLNNRRTFNDYLAVYYNTFTQYKIPFCLAVIDLDFFKCINDTYGHQKGDQVLINIAQIMRSNTRNTDVLARIGGEEFAIIFPDTSILSAHKVLQRIAHKVASYKDTDGVGTSLSAGLVESQTHHFNQDRVLSEADSLLYEAKNQGRNKIFVSGLN